ncbi:MAG: alanine--tRNA ligase-related protein [Candidatus Aenigmatarchaeota archaeon]
MHEDIWAGSGNFGPCIEFFSRGAELANQVYMQYQQTETGYKDLDIKVLDMGGGYERNVWFSQGSITSYESTYPTVVKELKKITGLSADSIKDFMQYAPYLNADETEDIEEEWKKIADNLGREVDKLKEEVKRIAKMYSIADHTRALLFGISDGSLPSNVGGGYNLRVMLRRALTFIKEEGWDIDLGEICEMHAKYLKPMFPELIENIEDVKKILNVEEKRYVKSRKKAKSIAEDIVKSGEITKDKIIELYESEGVKPEFLMEQARKQDKEIDFEIPNIKSILSQEHKKEDKEEETLEGDYPETIKLYYKDQDKLNFKAEILGIENNWVILDKTSFYPESGGQIFDKGKLNGKDVSDVQKFGNVIAHKVDDSNEFKKGQLVEGKVDKKRRKQLTIHHTAVHVLTAACKEVLGNHVWQAGASKTMEKSHLDITHYESLDEDTLEKIEEKCNEYVKKDLEIEKEIMPRVEAEKKYGMGIYHGGAVPGKTIRIVKVGNIDVEACGGTHLDNTSEIGEIVVLGSERIQDGVVRVTIVAGNKANEYRNRMSVLVEDLEDVLDTDREHIVEEARNTFDRWKELRKKLKKSKESKGEDLAGELEERIEDGVLIEKIHGGSDVIKEVSKELTEEGRLLILFGVQGDKVNVLISSSGDENAGTLVREICESLDGKGGGSHYLGQGVGKKDKLDEIMDNLRDGYGR